MHNDGDNKVYFEVRIKHAMSPFIKANEVTQLFTFFSWNTFFFVLFFSWGSFFDNHFKVLFILVKAASSEPEVGPPGK